MNELNDYAEQIIQQATASKLQIAVAESCTGGMLSNAITDIPGSSLVFKGGMVCYSDLAKELILGIEPQLIEKHTSCSPEVTMVMAENLLSLLQAHISIAITGAAGPSGTSSTTPGTVFIAVATLHSNTLVVEHHFTGSRTEVKRYATITCLKLLRDALSNLKPRI